MDCYSQRQRGRTTTIHSKPNIIYVKAAGKYIKPLYIAVQNVYIAVQNELKGHL